jgi:2-polyprenyl-3-methyl-5-hydroxy-6-metoxy-1,4-benzoquinol methylase
MKTNALLDRTIEILNKEKRGKVLDLGCGDGDYANNLKQLGFDVTAADLDSSRFRYHNMIQFQKCDITERLPFSDKSFDYVLLLEVIEHLKNPYFVIGQIQRILKDDGVLILSTPNILNIKSRLRFLIEGAFEYFREPPLDQIINPNEKIFNLHIFPYRFHELEYLLAETGFKIENIYTSTCENYELSFLLPLIKLQLYLKQRRSLKKKGIDYSRINKILLSKELLYGRHLILKARKNKES